jgi:hypothetical protein
VGRPGHPRARHRLQLIRTMAAANIMLEPFPGPSLRRSVSRTPDTDRPSRPLGVDESSSEPGSGVRAQRPTSAERRARGSYRHHAAATVDRADQPPGALNAPVALDLRRPYPRPGSSSRCLRTPGGALPRRGDCCSPTSAGTARMWPTRPAPSSRLDAIPAERPSHVVAQARFSRRWCQPAAPACAASSTPRCAL